jgi:hypothetical protein
MHGIAWTEELINGRVGEAQEQALSCGVPLPEVVMLHRDRPQKGVEFMDDVIVARPRAKLFATLLNDIASILQAGVWPYS